jgi:hypothetical protein
MQESVSFQAFRMGVRTIYLRGVQTLKPFFIYGTVRPTYSGSTCSGFGDPFVQGGIMQRIRAGVLVAIVALLAAAVPAPAHHSFAAEFDANKCMDLTGTFTSFEWQNPHGYFHLDVKDPGGNVTTWTFETVSLSTLKRSGTQRQDFTDNIGKIVTVRACLAKNGVKNRAAAETIKLSDGQVHRIGQDVEGKFSDNPKEGY